MDRARVQFTVHERQLTVRQKPYLRPLRTACYDQVLSKSDSIRLLANMFPVLSLFFLKKKIRKPFLDKVVDKELEP